MTSVLRNAARAKPLVLLENADSGALVRERQLALPEDLAGLPTAHPRPEDCLLAALTQERLDEATVLLSGFLRRRISALWGWWCVHQTLQAGQERAKAGSTPSPAHAGGTAGPATLPGGAPPAPPAVHGVSPDIGMTRADFAPPPLPPALAQMADPAAWPAVTVGPQGLVWLPPLLQNDPARPRSLAEQWFARKQQHLAALPPEQRAATEARLAAGRERMLAAFGGSPREMLNQRLRQRLEARAASDAATQAPHERLAAALAAKRGEIQARTAGVQAQLAEMKLHMPATPPRDDPASVHAVAALEAARQWILAPSDASAWTAFKSGEKCVGREQPAGLVAMACYWSGTNLQPPDAPQDAQPVPPPPGLAPRAVHAALMLARHLPGTGRTPEQWRQQYLQWGIEIAQGLLTIDRLLTLGGREASPWAGKPGFGRQHARPT